MTNLCFYHKVDLDGITSGAIVKYFVDNIECVGFNYFDQFPWERLAPGMTVFFVDVTLQPYTNLLKIYDIIKDGLFIFDHHASFLNSDEYKILKEKIPNNILCNDKVAACELTYSFFAAEKKPIWIKLLGQYDSWRDTKQKQFSGDFDWDTEVLPFQFGMRLQRWSPEKLFPSVGYMDMVDGVLYSEYINKGKLILTYQEQQNTISMGSSFDAEIDDGYRCLCVNNSHRNSQVFKSKWDKTKYDFMLVFSMTKDQKWSWSLYTDREDRDASKIAMKFGGGGHKGAAGFVTSTLTEVLR